MIFLDSGDRLMPGAIDAGLRALASHPACAMSYGRAVTMGSESEIRAAPEIPTVRAGHHAALLQTNLIPNPAMAMFRREEVERAGG